MCVSNEIQCNLVPFCLWDTKEFHPEHSTTSSVKPIGTTLSNICSVAVLAEISLWSPRKLFIFIIKKIIYRIKVSKKINYLILKKTSLRVMCHWQKCPMMSILRTVYEYAYYRTTQKLFYLGHKFVRLIPRQTSHRPCQSWLQVICCLDIWKCCFKDSL